MEEKKESVCKMEGVTSCQHDSLQRKKKAKQKKEGSPTGMTLKLPEGSITVTSNGCIMNGTTVLAHHTVTQLKHSQSSKAKSHRDMDTGQQFSTKGAVSKKEAQGKGSPAATRKAAETNKRQVTQKLIIIVGSARIS